MRNTCALHVGRLLEIRADAGYKTRVDVDQLFDAIELEVRRVPLSQQVVIATDWRRCPLMSDEASERLVARVMKLNQRIERSGAIASPDSPIAVLQFVRLIRQSKHPGRKLFESESPMIEWLSEVLSAREIERLKLFVNEPLLKSGPRVASAQR